MMTWGVIRLYYPSYLGLSRNGRSPIADGLFHGKSEKNMDDLAETFIYWG